MPAGYQRRSIPTDVEHTTPYYYVNIRNNLLLADPAAPLLPIV